MQNGIDDLQRRSAGLGLDVHGDAPSVVGDGDGVAGVDGHGDVLTVAGKGLIDGIVHDLINQMVQTGNRGGADIHTGTLANRFQTLQNLNLGSVIFLVYIGDVHFIFGHFLSSFRFLLVLFVLPLSF